MGWTYWELLALPADVYHVLIDQLRREHAARADRDAA